MTHQSAKIWEIAAGATLIAGAAAAGIWVMNRKRPTAEELEVARRQFLTQSGRIVDGTLLDCFEVPAEDGRMLTMLLYDYVIGGVDCGFGTFAGRVQVDTKIVWMKLKSLTEGAGMASKELWKEAA